MFDLPAKSGGKNRKNKILNAMYDPPAHHPSPCPPRTFSVLLDLGMKSIGKNQSKTYWKKISGNRRIFKDGLILMDERERELVTLPKSCLFIFALCDVSQAVFMTNIFVSVCCLNETNRTTNK